MKRLFMLISICLLASSVGCITSPPIVMPTPTSFKEPSSETDTPTPVAMHEPATKAITQTLVPTLSFQESEEEILKLLQNNGGCHFPCWWGLTPGETNHEVAEISLQKLITDSSSFDFYDKVSGGSWFIKRNDLILDLIVSFTHDRVLVDVIEGLRVTIEVKKELKDGVYETVWENPINQQILSSFMLPNILLVNGQPKEIYVYPNESWMYFNLVLDYSDKGFAIWYSAQLESLDDKYIGCMANAFTRLYLWAPEFEYTWAEGITGNGDVSEISSLNRDFRPLEVVTAITSREFYEASINGKLEGCIETQKKLWPGP